MDCADLIRTREWMCETCQQPASIEAIGPVTESLSIKVTFKHHGKFWPLPLPYKLIRRLGDARAYMESLEGIRIFPTTPLTTTPIPEQSQPTKRFTNFTTDIIDKMYLNLGIPKEFMNKDGYESVWNQEGIEITRAYQDQASYPQFTYPPPIRPQFFCALCDRVIQPTEQFNRYDTREIEFAFRCHGRSDRIRVDDREVLRQIPFFVFQRDKDILAGNAMPPEPEPKATPRVIVTGETRLIILED